MHDAVCGVIEFPLIFGETNFVKSKKSPVTMKFTALEKERPMVSINTESIA